jgi:hypothetical protein
MVKGLSVTDIADGPFTPAILIRTSHTAQQFHNSAMKTKTLTLPEITLIGGTRVALGLGLGLLLSDRLRRDARKGAGWALLAVGVLTTVPLVIHVLKKPDFTERAWVGPSTPS